MSERLYKNTKRALVISEMLDAIEEVNVRRESGKPIYNLILCDFSSEQLDKIAEFVESFQ